MPGLPAALFPAPAGMNRGRGSRRSLNGTVPRARGDEPKSLWALKLLFPCFPVPRARGDEPDNYTNATIEPHCSPRPRG